MNTERCNQLKTTSLSCLCVSEILKVLLQLPNTVQLHHIVLCLFQSGGLASM